MTAFRNGDKVVVNGNETGRVIKVYTPRFFGKTAVHVRHDDGSEGSYLPEQVDFLRPDYNIFHVESSWRSDFHR